VTDLAAVRKVAEQFDLRASVGAIRPFGGGHINETFLATAGTADYVVQRINRSIFRDPKLLVENAATVAAHLRGRFLPESVAARGGGSLVHDGADVWRAWRRVPGAATVAAPTSARVRSAARLLGRFHAGLADLAPARVAEVLPDFHGPARRLVLLRDVVAADPHDRARGVEREIEAAFAAAPLARIAGELVRRVPRRVAHNDAKLDNVLFAADEAICLVDLDTLMPSAWFWDVGDLVRTASTRAAEDEAGADRAVVDHELYAEILTGYRAGLAEGPAPTAAEDEAVELAGAIVTYEQALRFLTDWIAGDVYYRTTRPGQNRDRACAQLGLLASMPGTVAS
jgi:Ser/Thr protein kinase RdoA (MazF antagonist)